jgi:hypothetical protein
MPFWVGLLQIRLFRNAMGAIALGKSLHVERELERSILLLG